MPMVTRYSKTTGRKMVVPDHWDDHPVLGRNLRKTPLQRDTERKAAAAAPKTRTATTTTAPASGDNEKE